MIKGNQVGSKGSLETGGAQGGASRKQPKTLLLSSMSMLLLVVQGTMMSVVLRYSRIHSNSEGGSVYLPSVSVGIAEGIKLLICIIYLSVMGDAKEVHYEDDELVKTVWDNKGPSSPGRMTAQRWKMVIRDSVPMALPASMFVFQQVLLIWSATYLDAVTYQIFTQAFKLIPTAIFARVLLGQRLRPMQWASIPVLALGVVFITSNSSPPKNSATAQDGLGPMYFLAMAACSISGLSSAYAGVYFEKYVKGRLAGSLVKRNFQLGLYGVPFSWMYALVNDGRVIREYGPLNGFGASAWGVIWLQVFGGFIIALVVKYCDNILKNFALAGSVIMTVLVSIPLFGQWPSSLFLVGVSIVLSSIFMYGGSFPRINMPSITSMTVIAGVALSVGVVYMLVQTYVPGLSAMKMSHGT